MPVVAVKVEVKLSSVATVTMKEEAEDIADRGGPGFVQIKKEEEDAEVTDLTFGDGVLFNTGGDGNQDQLHELTTTDQHGERSHVCALCGKTFTTATYLSVHSRIHSGEKPNQCHLCGKRFTASQDLLKHRRTHTGEKPYQCPLCARRFTQFGQLQRHSATHGGERPHLCPDCGQSFSRSDSLERHRRVHTGVRPYHCTCCGKAFTRSRSLRTHTRSCSTHAALEPILDHVLPTQP